MKISFKLFAASALYGLVMSSCNKNPVITNPDGGTTVTVYSITENFESNVKASYAKADVNLSTGSWNFDDALVANTASDAKNGSWSVRLRTGSITTNFQIKGLKKVFVSSAKYGNDASSTWMLQMSSDSGKTFSQVGATVTDTSKTLRVDSFDITTTAPIQIRITKSGTTRINLDDVIFKGEGDSGIKLDTTDGASDTTGTALATAARYTTVGSDAPPKTGDNSNMLLGNPSNADSVLSMSENYLINQSYYIESYSSSRATPNWVSWHLDASNITGAVKRQDNFAAWAGLPASWFAAQSNSYSNSGYERGHNCPSGDRTSSVDANSSTFLMTNMIPQTAANNEGTWNNFESYIRTQIQAGFEAYVIMGSYGKTEVISTNKITVPTNVWKVVVFLTPGNSDISRITSDTKIIAINTPNTSSVNSDWTKYIVSVDAIESATGYDLLSALPTYMQNIVEAKVYVP